MCPPCVSYSAHGMCAQVEKSRELRRFHIFLDPDERERLEQLARKNERTLAAEIRLALRGHIERMERIEVAA